MRTKHVYPQNNSHFYSNLIDSIDLYFMAHNLSLWDLSKSGCFEVTHLKIEVWITQCDTWLRLNPKPKIKLQCVTLIQFRPTLLEKFSLGSSWTRPTLWINKCNELLKSYINQLRYDTKSDVDSPRRTNINAAPRLRKAK